MTTYENSCLFLMDRDLSTGWRGAYHRGHARCVKAAKRTEAEERNTQPPGWGLAHAANPGGCTSPSKKVYPSKAAVSATFNRMPRWRKRQNLAPYQCPAGHWHLGRDMHRAAAVWRKK